MSVPFRALRRVVRRIPGAQRSARAVRGTRDVVQMVQSSKSRRAGGVEQKGTARMIAENLWYLARYDDVDHHYFQAGLDRKGVRLGDVIPYAEFRRLRDRRNAAQSERSYDYICLLRDKFVFSQFATSLGYPTPRNVAFVQDHEVDWLAPRRKVPLATLLESDLDGFCKPFDGIMGHGAFALRTEAGQALVNGAPVDLDGLAKRLKGRYLLQERVVQHAALARLHPASVNALRIVTTLEDGEARLFTTHLRVGAHGEPTNSVGVGGGFAVPIDSATGRLYGKGLTRDGYASRHPDSGVIFDGYEVPRFEEAVDLARRFHEDLRYVHSVGWDVAITPDGPTFIEGNDNWGGGIVMAFEPDFKERFLAL